MTTPSDSIHAPFICRLHTDKASPSPVMARSRALQMFCTGKRRYDAPIPMQAKQTDPMPARGWRNCGSAVPTNTTAASFQAYSIAPSMRFSTTLRKIGSTESLFRKTPPTGKDGRSSTWSSSTSDSTMNGI